jgi:outer membrane protein OmpA-like peptidoglycan-associated protein
MDEVPVQMHNKEKAKKDIGPSKDSVIKAPIINTSFESKPAVVDDSNGPNYIIYFDFNKHLLKSNSIKTLNEVVGYMNKHPKVKVSLSGHTDLTGNIEYNQKLSKKRVLNARYYLMSKQLDADRIVTDYYGKSNPVVQTIEDALGWKNRRVEIFIIK